MTVRALTVLAVLTTCGLSAGADPRPAKNAYPQPLTKAIVAAWKKAGAEVGWMRVRPFGWFEFLSAKEGKAGDLPAFRFLSWKGGVLATLPVPAAFGLDLGESPVSDAGLKEVAQLQRLQALDLTHTKVTDVGLKELAALQSLQALNLSGTPVTDAGLKELAGLKNLHTLSLSGSKVTDAMLKELVGLKHLQTLDLFHTPITDAGLKELAKLKTLQSLNLGFTQVTNMGMQELRHALPGCQIRD
jgi:hypothetical protein